jgi:transcriptional regulator with XRE-family HTH domain
MSTAALLAQRSAIEVGRRLLALRSALGLKAYEMCEAVVVQTNTWSQWENGKRMADLPAMMRVADRFGADLNYIYMGSLASLPADLARKVSDELAKTAPPPDEEISAMLLRRDERRRAKDAVETAEKITAREKKKAE